jgi:hypothetical protein
MVASPVRLGPAPARAIRALDLIQEFVEVARLLGEERKRVGISKKLDARDMREASLGQLIRCRGDCSNAIPALTHSGPP